MKRILPFLIITSALTAETLTQEDERFIHLLTEQGLHKLAYDFAKDRLARGGLEDDIETLLQLRVGNLALTLASKTIDPEERDAYTRESERMINVILPKAARITKLPKSAIEFIRLLVNRGNMALTEWRNSKRETDRKTAYRLCALALAHVDTMLDTLTEKIADIEATADEVQLEGNTEYKQLDSWVAEGNYRKAWGSFYLAQTLKKDSPERPPLLEQADEFFDEFTGEYMNNIVVVNCFLGKAQVMYEMGDISKAIKILGPIKRGTAPKVLVDQANVLRINWMQEQKRYMGAIEMIDEILEPYSSDKMMGNAETLMLLKQAECYFMRYAEENRPADRKRGIQISERVSAKGGAWRNQALSLVTRYPAGGLVKTDKGPLEVWIEAEKRYASKHYPRAEMLYSKVIKDKDRLTDPTLLPPAYFRRASCQYLMNDFRLSAISFEKFLRQYSKHELAEKAAFLVAQSYYFIYLRSQDENDGAKALSVMKSFTTSHPKSKDISRTSMASGDTLSLMGRHEDALEVLKKAKDVEGGEAVILLTRRRQLDEALQDGDAGAKAKARKLAADMTTYMDRRGGQGTWVAQVQLSLAEMYMSAAFNQADDALDLLENFSQIHSGVPSRLKLQAIRNRLTLYCRQKQWAAAEVELVKFLDRPSTSEASGAALLLAAQGMNTAGRAALGKRKYKDSTRYFRRSAAAYEALLEWMDANQLDDAQKREAHIRAIQIYLYVQDPEKAGPHLQAIYDPNRKEHFIERGIALVEQMRKNYREALQRWQAIEKGVERRTNDWFEARFYIIKDMAEAGQKEKAIKLLKFTKVLSPGLGGAKWKPRFLKLEKEL